MLNRLGQVTSITSKWTIGGMVMLIGLWLAYTLLTLTRYPIVFVDEGWFANSAWNWTVNGVHFDTMHAGPLDQFGYEWLRRNFVAEWVWSIAFKVWGVGFAQARLVSWLIGVGLLIVLFLVARRLYNLHVALLSVLLLVSSHIFLRSSHLARQDILLAFIGVLGFAIGVYALKGNRWWAHLLGAFVVAFSTTIHQNGVNYILGFASMYLIYYGWRVVIRPGTWLAAAGGVGGIAGFLGLHILPNPDVYFRMMNINLSSTHVIPLLAPMSIPYSIFREVITTYDFDNNLLAFGLLLSGALVLFQRRATVDRLLLAFTTGSWLGFVLIVGNKTFLYPILLYPFMMMIIAAAAYHMLTLPSGWQTRWVYVRPVIIAALCGVLVFNGLYAAQIYRNFREYDYQAILNQLRSVIPPGSSVMTMPNWWFGFTDDNFHSNFTVNFYHYLNGLTFDEAMDLIRPDYYIVDSTILLLQVEHGSMIPTPLNGNPIPKKPFQNMLTTRGTKIFEFKNRWHSGFEIYALDWDD